MLGESKLAPNNKKGHYKTITIVYSNFIGHIIWNGSIQIKLVTGMLIIQGRPMVKYHLNPQHFKKKKKTGKNIEQTEK